MMNGVKLFDYTNLKAFTSVPDSNSSYLLDLHYAATPVCLSNSTIGFLSILSILQYQAPYTNPMYSDAMNHVGKAAYIQSGGQDFQNKLQSRAEMEGKKIVYQTGITDNGLGIILGVAKILREKQINIDGPKIYYLKTHLTAATNYATLGLKYEW